MKKIIKIITNKIVQYSEEEWNFALDQLEKNKRIVNYQYKNEKIIEDELILSIDFYRRYDLGLK